MNTILSIEYLRFTIGGYGSSKYEIKITKKTVSFSVNSFSYDFSLKHKKKLDQNKLKEFTTRISKLDILSWENRYYDNDVCDGEQWDLSIRYNGSEKKKIYGSNAYPGSKIDSFSRTPKFENFLLFIKELIEEPTFF